MTAPTLSGNFSITIDKAEVSEAAPPIAEVVLTRKQNTMNVSGSESIPPKLKSNDEIKYSIMEILLKESIT